MRAPSTPRRSNLRWWVIPVFFCLLHLSVAAIATSTPPLRKNVLVINEVGLAHTASALVTQRLLSELASSRDYQVEFYIESLDSTLFTDEGSQQETESLLVRQYQNYKLDVIVATGPTPIRFLSQVSSTFLPNVPVVFCGSSEEQAGHPKLDARFTGFWMKLEPAMTLNAALQLSPETQHVVVVGGSSTFDKGVEAITRASLSSYPASLDFTYLTDLEMSTLLERLRHLPSRTIVLYTSFFRDAAGNHFFNATIALPLVSEAANAPVFGMSDTYLGNGSVGGYVTSFAEQGKIAARLVSDILRGKKAQDIPIQSSPGVYMFDWRQLQRWGLSEKKLPAGSVVLFHEPTLWERAKWILLTGLLVILALGSLTVYLLYEQKQLTRAKSEQMRLSGMLINAQEDERSRLASELHDDFSQRLAVLSLGLETATEMIPESPQEATRQLHELLNSAGEIGADLHTLSHRLHSSALERLGLVSGVNAFCKEFVAQQGIPVTFLHDNVARSVDPDVALCLFRIAQEGLRNVKKHSGASKADVRLETLGDTIHLSITDNGRGFNVIEDSHNHGLGIWSMQARARLIGARFEIHSEPQKGTRINVWTRRQRQKDARPANQAAVPSIVSGI
jgi:signal transduction histidine kinase